jgi:predicted dehydrogenase
VLAAVGSRAVDAAARFARTHGIPTAHGSYDDLLADPRVQAVYVSLPNSLHREWTIKALAAGKHVLCEKPIATSAAEAQEMFDVANRHGRVLVEAFMYRAHPLTHAVMETFRRGEIGALKLIRTSFCYRTSKVAGNIRFEPALAGGALMDIGCYCINFSRMVAGSEPVSVSAVGQRHNEGRGVDVVAAGTMVYPGGVVASFTCGMLVQANNAAYICGDEGYIEVPIPWKPPERGAGYSVVRATPPLMDSAQLEGARSQPNSGPRKDFTVDAGVELYGVEADDFAATVLDGKAPMMTAGETIGNMRVLEEMRRQVMSPHPSPPPEYRGRGQTQVGKP